MYYINAHIDFVYKIPYRRALCLSAFRPSARANKGISHTNIDFEYIAKDLISIHEVWKKLLQCAQFGCVRSVLIYVVYHFSQ